MNLPVIDRLGEPRVHTRYLAVPEIWKGLQLDQGEPSSVSGVTKAEGRAQAATD